MRSIADARGISSYSEAGFDRGIVFGDGINSTSIPLNKDLEAFSAFAVMRLIGFFPNKLTKQDFWPELREE